MESFGIGGVAGLGALGAAGVLVTALRVRMRLRRRRAAAPKASAVRLESLAAAQAELAARLDGLAAEGGAEAKLQAMASQMLALIRDKNAAMETAMAGLDQLRARMRTLEQIGEPAEARALVEKLAERLDALQAAQSAGAAALEARIAAFERPGETQATALAERLAKLHAQKEAGLEAVLGRLGALEQAVAARAPQAELDRFAERLEAVQGRVAVLEDAENPFAEISEQLTRLYAQKDATVEAVLGRLAPLEAKLGEIEHGVAARDPRAALDGLAVRLEAVQGALDARVAALEGTENPFAEISEQLTRLYGQKDAAVEAVLGRLQPLEAKLGELEQAVTTRDPRAALDRFAERLEAVQGRVAVLEDAENPFAEISEQLTRLYAQKDATVEAVLGRLAPLEAKLGEIEHGVAARDPRAALDGLAVRLEAVQGALDARVAALEGTENPFAEISEQLTRLYGQKDAAVEAVLGRLQPLEAKLGELEQAVTTRDPRAALDRFAERLEAVQGRVAVLEDAENPFAEISEQLTRLYAQKDATVEAVLGRLAPLEAKLGEIEHGVAARDPRAALDGLAVRLEAVQGALDARVAALEGTENPFAEISEQLTRLYGQKDAAVEAVLGRLQPLEAKLGELEAVLAKLMPLAEADPRAEIDGLAARLAELHWAQGEVAAGLAALKAAGDEAAPFTAIADQLTRLYAQKDAMIEAVLVKLAPLEARLAELEGRPWDPDAEEARAQAQAIAAQMIAARAAAEQISAQTGRFADRLALLEASLPRLSAAQTLLMQVLERQAAAPPEATEREAAPSPSPVPLAEAEVAGPAAGWGDEPLAEPAPVPGPAAATAAPRPAPRTPPAELGAGLDEIWSLPRLISLHRK